MAIKKQQLSTEKKLDLSFDNGDLEAIKSVMEKFGFIDEEAMLRFALVVLLKTDSNGVYVSEGENRVFVSPSAKILKQEDSDTQE